MKLINDFLQRTTAFQKLLQKINSGNVLLSGMTPSFQGQLLSALKGVHENPILVITRNEHDGRKLYESLVDVSDAEISPFLLDEFMTANVLSASSELRFERLQTLKSLKENQNQVVITNIGALRRYLTPKDVLESAEITLQVASIYEPTDLAKKAIQLGYKRVSTVEAVGEFSMRGGIFDIFPKEAEHPVRIEFFDDEVETIRSFDIQTQRSIEKVGQVEITLLYELYYEDALLPEFEAGVRLRLKKQQSGLSGESKDLLQPLQTKTSETSKRTQASI